MTEWYFKLKRLTKKISHIGLWENQEDLRLKEILGITKKYTSKEEAFLEFLKDSTRAMLIEKILETEKNFLESTLKEESSKQ